MDRARLTTIFLVVLFAMGPISASTPDQSGQSSGEESPSPLNCSSSTPHDDQTNYYVDGSSGDDTYPGTQACPTKTIQQAVTKAGSDDTITVASGTYMESVSIDSEGQTLRAATGARVILDGSESVTGDLDATWTQHTELDSGWVWKVDLPKDAWQLFLSYEEEMPARWPNANFSDFSALDDENYWAHGTISGTDINNSDDDGDGYPDVGCPSGEELHLEGNDWHCVEYLNGELEDDPSCCSSHTGLVDSGIDPVGSIAVLNIGSFRTWSREVLTFDSTEGSFTYAQVPSSGWKFKHHMYFLTQKLELLDTNGEWFFDDDSEERTLYYMPRGDDDPNELDIRVKTKPYGVICDHYDNVKVEGIDFFAAAFKLDDCDESEIRNSTLLYPSTSKRSLGIAGEDQENRYVSRVDDCMGCLIDTCEFLYTDGAAFEAHGGTGSSVGNQINNSYFYYIDWSGSDQISLMTTIAMSGSTNLFTNNTMHKTGTSATIRIGNSPQVMFNEIYDTAHLQSDGTIIQMMQGEQQGAEIAYNWVHDSPKYGIRMDGPFGGTNSGNNASVHHNVVWNINGGIISKGDYHNVSHNTAFDSPVDSSGRNDIVVLYDDTGGNENSVVQYNAADRIAGHRTNTLQVSPFPQNSNISDNWNGYDSDNSGETIASQLADFTAFDFRPVVGSEIDLMLAGAYLSSQTATAPSDPGNYDPSTYYWNPGIKRDPLSPWSRSTYTLPCTGGSYFDGTSCQDSSLGHYVDGWGQTSQVSCAAGTYQPSTAQTACLDADAGHYVGTTGSTSQTACAAGTYQPSTAQTACLDADAGHYVGTTGSTSQTACAAGTYQPSTGQPSCTDADAGHYVDSTGQSAQTACAAGTYQPSTGQPSCTDADAGHYVDSTGSTSQTACAAGTYQPSTGQPPRRPASTPTPATTWAPPDPPPRPPARPGPTSPQPPRRPASTPTPATTSTRPASRPRPPAPRAPTSPQPPRRPASTPTPATTSAPPDPPPRPPAPRAPTSPPPPRPCPTPTPATTSTRPDPTACAAGTYQPSTGQPSCTDADAGHYVDSTGSTSQTACAAGTYQPSTGQTACLDADAGHYVDSTGSTSQTACAAGTYQPSTGQPSCTDADAGHYVGSTGSTSQTACAAGTYQPSTAQTACLDADAGHYVASTGSTSQTACAAGTYQPSTAQTACLDADAGHYVGTTGSTSQTACAAGTYQPSTGQTACLDADAGHYVASTGSTSQTACAAGTYQPSNRPDGLPRRRRRPLRRLDRPVGPDRLRGRAPTSPQPPRRPASTPTPATTWAPPDPPPRPPAPRAPTSPQPPRRPASTPTPATTSTRPDPPPRPPARPGPTSPQPPRRPASTPTPATTSTRPASRPRPPARPGPTSPQPPRRPASTPTPATTSTRPDPPPRPPARRAPTSPQPPRRPASTPTPATTSTRPATGPDRLRGGDLPALNRPDGLPRRRRRPLRRLDRPVGPDRLRRGHLPALNRPDGLPRRRRGPLRRLDRIHLPDRLRGRDLPALNRPDGLPRRRRGPLRRLDRIHLPDRVYTWLLPESDRANDLCYGSPGNLHIHFCLINTTTLQSRDLSRATRPD